MALYIRSYFSLIENYKLMVPIIYKTLENIQPIRYFVHKSDENDYESSVDVVDEFTEKLIQRKSEKWDAINMSKSKLFTLLKKNDNNHIDINELSVISNHDFNNFLRKYIATENFGAIKTLINYCIVNEKVLDFKVLLSLLSICGHYGDKANVLRLIDLGKKVKIVNDSNITQCQQYEAEALWIQGNVQSSIEIFKNLYICNFYLRRNLCLLLRFLIGRTTESRTEAILVQIREFTEDLATNYNEYAPLECLWQTCILSEWFSDQTSALQMIEDNPKLRKYLSEKYKHIVSVALKTNKSDVVQRLFELFLKYKMTEHYISTLRLLFDHHYLKRDFYHCAAIIRWSTDLNIPLRSEQSTKFVNMLINHYGDKRQIKKTVEKNLRPPQFKLKF